MMFLYSDKIDIHSHFPLWGKLEGGWDLGGYIFSPAFNLATEEYLFSEKSEDYIFLYVNTPSVIVGSNQAVKNEVDLDFCKQNNIQIIRRLSGGGAVYHDEGNLNFCFISNSDKNKSSLSTDFLIPIVAVLQSFNIPVEIGKRKDLWINGFKISGTASHVSKNRELHHGTLLFDTNLAYLQKSLTSQQIYPEIKATKSVSSPVKNIKEFLSESYSVNDFFQAFSTKLLEYQNLKKNYEFTDEEIQSIKQIEKKYLSDEWNFRK